MQFSMTGTTEGSKPPGYGQNPFKFHAKSAFTQDEYAEYQYYLSQQPKPCAHCGRLRPASELNCQGCGAPRSGT